MNKNYCSEIKETIENLTGLDSAESLFHQNRDGEPFPSRSILKEVVSITRSVLFPGFFGNDTMYGGAGSDTLLGGITPEGQLAVEYWQTVANLPNGWARANQGLHQLIQREPSRALYRLARAQLALQKNPIAPEVLTDLDRLSRAAGNASDRPRGLWRRAACSAA